MKFLRGYFDDYALHEHCDILKIRKSLQPPITNNYLINPNVHGAHYRNSTFGQQVVEVDIRIKHDVLYHLDQLNKILYRRGNKRLFFPDQPDRYLLCKLSGEAVPTSRYGNSLMTLQFVSPDYFWRPTAGKSTVSFDSNGRAVINNLGTAPTPITIELNFPSDCGYLGATGPDEFISLGNIEEKDKTPVPRSEFAMNEEMDQVTTWTRQTNASSLIPDYNKISSAGTAKHDQWGMLLDPSTLGTSDQWHGHAYMRNFDMGSAEREADNFSLRSRIDIADLSGSRNRTMATLIVVMDENNIPIMTTSVYDVSGDKNELTVTFKVRDTGNRSKIIHTAKMPRLNGYINMEKSGNVFTWVTHNNATTTATATTRTLKKNDIVNLTTSANTIYDWNGKKLRLDARIKGEPLQVAQELEDANGTANQGRYLLKNVRYGYVEGFFDAKDIKQTAVDTQQSIAEKTIRHTITDSTLAQLRPYKVFVWQGKWGATTPYSQFSINSVVVQRKYTVDALELENTFMAGDQLVIDGETSQVYKNGRIFEGYHDWDSRVITVDGGPSEISILPSNWAQMPTGRAIYESRWL